MDIIAREKAKFPPEVFTPEAETRLRDELTLQSCFEGLGLEVLYRSKPEGPEVVAVGDEERLAATGGLPPEERNRLETWLP